jgi:hypothetical protein
MDQAYFSTLAALAGTIIGGLTSFGTAWLTQSIQSKSARKAAESTMRQTLYASYMDELAALYSHALSGNEVDYSKLVNAFALKGRIKLICSPPVEASADRALKFLVDLYMGPKRTALEMREMMDIQSSDTIGDFASVCREELRQLGLR